MLLCSLRDSVEDETVEKYQQNISALGRYGCLKIWLSDEKPVLMSFPGKQDLPLISKMMSACYGQVLLFLSESRPFYAKLIPTKFLATSGGMELNCHAENSHRLHAKSIRRGWRFTLLSFLCVVLALCVVWVLGCWVLMAVELPCPSLCSHRHLIYCS